MKQHTTPAIIIGNQATTLERVPLVSGSDTGTYDEDWIQRICFENPTLLPVEELEPTFAGMIPICRELPTKSGSVDLMYLNEYGFITIGECMLWRNPEARRKVVGQVLDYAKDIAQWDYAKFEAECLRARKDSTGSLFEIIHEYYPDIEEPRFIDSVQNNLQRGRFLLAIIGDGIRENMKEMAEYIQRNGNLNFTLALIELPVYQKPDKSELVITPRILPRTVEIERTVLRTGEEVVRKPDKPSEPKTISEKAFYERLTDAIGRDQADGFHSFVQELSSDLNILPKLGRGKKLSLNLKSADDTYNFASVQEDGEVWFYGIVTKTEELGDKSIGIKYLKQVADLINGSVDDSYKEWSWCVKRDGEYPSITDFIRVKDAWKKIIEDTLEAIRKKADSESA
ncbi:MAG: hypothetical protein KFH87_00860 [Bacteroidetes bacterium]|nr:hypothetical protein [Bacteroidota bacterium]